ncbi:hypothetical protein DIPPA_16058 [Diplonema papillatum]|nr:hypothetical protein DIPPA_16058 [Diplonema papillatum]
MASPAQQQLEVFAKEVEHRVARLKEELDQPAPEGGDGGGGAPATSRIRCECRALLTAIGDVQAGAGADELLRARLDQVSEGLSRVELQLPPETDWDVAVLDDERAELRRREAHAAGKVTGKTRRAARESLGVGRKKIGAEGGKQSASERQRLKATALNQSMTLTAQLKEQARLLGDTIGKDEAVLKSSLELADKSLAEVNKQTTHVPTYGTGLLGSILGQFTETAVLAAYIVFFAVASLFILQIVIMFPSVRYVYVNGQAPPGYVSSAFSLLYRTVHAGYSVATGG